MADLVLIDSDILIDFGNGNETAGAFLNTLQEQYVFGTSVITEMEVLVGSRNKADLRAWEKLLLNFEVFNINPTICA